MKYFKHFLYLGLLAGILSSCGSDDDSSGPEIRDPQEVYEENLDSINKFLRTHYYNQEDFQNTPDGDDFEIEFMKIEDGDTSRTPLSELVTSRTLRRGDIDYQIFVLNVRQGSGDRSPTFADSTLVSYQGLLLDKTKFDGSENSVWFDLPGAIDGFSAGVTGFNDATTITANADGTISYKNGGIGAMFLPSGVAYFNRIQPGIPSYSPLVFTFQLRRVRYTDHDGDGILSIYEDLNNDKNLRSANFLDDTDRNRISNYLDADDDGDGIPTKDEDADPNGDGNPSDALDTDRDGIPDYLDNRTENT